MFFYFYRLSFKLGKHYYIDTIFHLKYSFFEWVEVLPPNLMYLCFYLGLLCAVLITLGLHYKNATKLLFVIYTYIFFIDISYWNNHYYAYALINGFFMITDAHKSYSLDRKRLNLNDTIPQWQLLLFQFQIVLIYFYGGLSKLQNKDWLYNITGYSLLKSSLNLNDSYLYPLSLILTYGGLLYDLTIGFLLSYKKTVWKCLPIIILFNISNAFIFSIGSFPFAMIASFVLFIPVTFFNKETTIIPNLTTNKQHTVIVSSLLITYCFFQLVFPFRSLLIKGNVFWSSEAKMFSWHMMSSNMNIKLNDFTILEYDDDKTIILKETPLDASKFLNGKQLKRITKTPTVLPQFAKFVKKESELAGFKNVAITSNLLVSKNFREAHRIIDPNTDLSTVKVTPFKHNEWILLYDTECGFFKNE